MNIPFWKMHGAGNDFILVDDRGTSFPAADSDWIADIATRRTGIGCDGVILIQPSDQADFRMRFFNPDGGEVEMCGNGARCVARLAHQIGAAPANMTIDTVAGVLEAAVEGGLVRLQMSTPIDWRMGDALDIDGEQVPFGSVNTGVPHVVVELDDLDQVDIARMGAAIRHHNEFAPAGTNANFISVTGPDSLRIRTYERGVEAETLACGTGIVASALIAGKNGRVTAPVQITSAGGDVLTVDYRLTDDGASDVCLLGPAAHVYTGALAYGA